MATYAIGDIHGCFDAFMRLLDRCAFNPSRDTLWLTGDLVNRGPRSLETLRFVHSLGEAAIAVLGNHDFFLLRVAEGFGKRSGDDTFDEILAAPDRAELLTWLRHRPLCHREGDYCLVHAGLPPQWSAKRARELAAEVETVLRGPSWREFMDGHIWGNLPKVWQDSLEGWPRLRTIVNAMARMRFCSPEGVMDFSAKGELSQAPDGFAPWFDLSNRHSADATLVVGHWSALGLLIAPNLLAIDSGCLWGGKLTAVRLEDRKLFQVEGSKEETRPLIRG
jgi:bis(5'-nucleosyl)-tetraphosphatase (symmetrical)